MTENLTKYDAYIMNTHEFIYTYMYSCVIRIVFLTKLII